MPVFALDAFLFAYIFYNRSLLHRLKVKVKLGYIIVRSKA